MPSVTTVTVSTPACCAADDEGRRLVVGIGGAGADAGDEGSRRISPPAHPSRLPRRATTAPPASTVRGTAPARIGADQLRRRRWRSGAGAGCGRGGCGTAPGRHRSARCLVAPRRAPKMFCGRAVRLHGRSLQPGPPSTRCGRAGTWAIVDAGGVADGGQDGRRGRHQRRLADALGAVGTERFRDPRSGCTRSPARRRRSGSGSRAGSRCGRADIPPSAPGRGPGRCRHGSGPRPASG